MVFGEIVGLVLGLIGFWFRDGVPVAQNFLYVSIDALQMVSIAGFQYCGDVLFCEVS